MTEIVTYVPFVTNVRFLFRTAATRGVSFVAASFTSLFAMVPRTVNAAAHPCLRGLSRRMVPRISCPYRLHVAKRHSSAPAAIWSRRLCVVPRTRMLPLIHGAAFMYAAAHQCSRAFLWPRVCSAAHSYTAAHLCCRVLV